MNDLQKAEYAMHQSHDEVISALAAMGALVTSLGEKNGDIYEEDASAMEGMARVIRRCMRRSYHCEKEHQTLWSRQQDEIKNQETAADFRRRQQVAHAAVAAAILNGTLARPDTCGTCGEAAEGIVAHHDDYGAPLDVRWLCRPCHGKHHAEHGSAK